MKIVAISDTHDQHALVKIPKCDVLVVAGDFTSPRIPVISNYANFAEWLRAQPAKHKIIVAGNHDTLFEQQPDIARIIFKEFTYLQDSGVTIDGIKFWGSPWTPFFNNWAFMQPDHHLELYFDLIPDDTDVLITHGPPLGTLDQLADGQNIGSEALLKRILQLNLTAHFFGHAHHGYGRQDIFYNVAQCNEEYDITNSPVVVEIKK